MRAALILFAHGSRDPEWAAPFRAVQQRLATERSDITIDLAFLEIMEPSLLSAVERLAESGHRQFTIAPMFMAPGAHVKRDLARLSSELMERHPGIELKVLPAVGEVKPVIGAITAWLVANI